MFSILEFLVDCPQCRDGRSFHELRFLAGNNFFLILMLCDLEEINESSCWGKISRYTLSKHCLSCSGWCSYNLKLPKVFKLVYNYIIVSSPQTELGHYENNRFVYQIHRSPMCDYMINFVHKLKQLPEKYMMNSVLENFTILQVCTLLYVLLMVYDHSVIFLLSGFTNLQTNCPFWKPKLKTRYPLISHLFLCASCVWPPTLGSLSNDDGYIIGFTCRGFVVVVIE